jgi:diguanylate cyclase (GGDEF)-like protein/PAS domain S-box-containing protein
MRTAHAHLPTDTALDHAGSKPAMRPLTSRVAPLSFEKLDPAALQFGAWSQDMLAIQSAVIAAVGDLDEVMRVVVEGAMRVVTNAAGAAVEMREGEAIVYRAASGSCADRVGTRLQLGGSLSGRAMLTGEPQLCLETETDRRVDLAACRSIGIRSMMVVPLPLQGKYVGVLKIYAEIPAAFDNRDLLTAQLLASPIAIGLASAAQEEAVRVGYEAAKMFAATFDQAAVGIAHVAPDGRFMRVNDRFCVIAGHDRATLIAGGFQQITHPDDLDNDLENVAALVAGEIGHYAMEKRYQRRDGSLVWVNLTVSLVRHSDGTPDFFVSVIEDISSRRAAEEAALQDSLTGLPNRRWLIERLSGELARQSRKPMCIAYLDLDGFKAVNDRFGHKEGDQCLIAVARALKSSLRKDDIVGRLAGDEFVVILPDTSKGIATSLLGRLQQSVNEISQWALWDISVSVGGIMVRPTQDDSAEDMLAAADDVMYHVKRGDRELRIIDTIDRAAA